MRRGRTPGALALIAAFALPWPAQAADSGGNFAVRGLGALPCADVVRKVDDNAPDLVVLVAWSDGALTEINRFTPDTFDAIPFVDPQGVFTTLVVNLCKRNPAITFEAALQRVVAILHAVRVTRGAPPIVIVTSETRLSIHPETIGLVQDRLIALGLLTRPATQGLDAPTEAALGVWQTARGLPATGTPSADTVLPLLLGQ